MIEKDYEKELDNFKYNAFVTNPEVFQKIERAIKEESMDEEELVAEYSKYVREGETGNTATDRIQKDNEKFGLVFKSEEKEGTEI